MAEDGLIQGKLTDESIALMRRRIGYPNPTVRAGVDDRPWNTSVTADAIRRFAIGIGDDNPLYVDADYARRSRWGGPIAPPGFDMSMGIHRNRKMDPAFEKETRPALRGVQLFNSGGEYFYYAPMAEGTTLYKSEFVDDVQVKESTFAGRSAIVTNVRAYWDQDDRTLVLGKTWYVHAERKKTSDSGTKDKYAGDAPASYTDEQLAEIDAAYDAEFRRGSEPLFLEDVSVGQTLPRMVKGPITITDMMNLHMGAGWLVYGNPPYRLARENRRRMRGFYSKNEFGAWDTIQRVHWDRALANRVGVQNTYDIGPMRRTMVCHYCTNFAGDNAWVYRTRFELRRFNYMGDVTWLQGKVTAARIDDLLGPLIEIEISGINQRGDENIRGGATILCDSRHHGPMRMPAIPPTTANRS